MFVNKEISELIYGLINSTKILDIDGVLCAVSFHSIEDRIIKYFFKSLSEDKKISRYLPEQNNQNKLFLLKSKKPITPTQKELTLNRPSRSAKLRYAIKKKDFYEFDTDIQDQFKNLIEIENFGDKL